MKDKSFLKDSFSLMWKLMIICVIVALLLAVVNSVTAPIISQNNQKNLESAMTEVLPDAGGFEEINIDFTPSESGVSLYSLYSAGDKGYVATTVCSEGYGGDIMVTVGVNPDMTVNKVKIMSISETAGLGMKANTDEFLGQYSGQKAGIGVEKNGGGSIEDNTISAISGATYTSKAVTKAVNCGIEAAIAGGAR